MEPMEPEINRKVNESSNVLNDLAEEDKEEGMDRMVDEGGGVVEQNVPAGAPILRNDLTDVQS
ncbi:hypothetical protein DNHGIG_02260 [Collibacillus ludicampi]|jgi:hypothetical protein|uniref:Uncharacterized protein n=1 Tax=Collibacillus ludicampi TaxID=2771369 RepID=A0AAV4LA33_9BACL|nr:hypothetical protein [Collibacillus ludicampi]GIM44677.1 hypothetical protein DNHGIG_02260 [Collibacillus ludicampi]